MSALTRTDSLMRAKVFFLKEELVQMYVTETYRVPKFQFWKKKSKNLGQVPEPECLFFFFFLAEVGSPAE